MSCSCSSDHPHLFMWFLIIILLFSSAGKTSVEKLTKEVEELKAQVQTLLTTASKLETTDKEEE